MANRTAILEGFDNAPSFDTGVPTELQFAVNLGAICADAWLELKGTVRLHDYFAHQTAAFSRGIQVGIKDDGVFDSHQLAMSRHAFTAGLVGRVQQHLLAALDIVMRDTRTTH